MCVCLGMHERICFVLGCHGIDWLFAGHAEGVVFVCIYIVLTSSLQKYTIYILFFYLSTQSKVPCFDAQNCATCCKATSMSTILDAPWQALGEQSMLDMDVLRRESALQPWLRMQAPALHVPAAVCCTSHRTQTMGVLKKHSVLVLFATRHSRKWGISRQLQCVLHVVWLIYHGRRSSTQHRLSLTI